MLATKAHTISPQYAQYPQHAAYIRRACTFSHGENGPQLCIT